MSIYIVTKRVEAESLQGALKVEQDAPIESIQKEESKKGEIGFDTNNK